MLEEYRTSTIQTLVNSSFNNLFDTLPERLYAYIGTAILLFGSIGNLLNIILFARLESLRRLASSLFLLVSFIASEGVLLTALLTRVIHGFSGIDPTHTSIILCKARWMIRTVVNAVSLTCVCLAAIDRYRISCRNVQQNRIITMKQARWTIFFTVLFWSGVFSSYAVFYTSPTPASCSIADRIFSYFVSYFNLVHYSLLPLTTLSLFCYLTWQNLGQQPATFLNGGRRLRDQVTRMLIAQSLMICITTVPNMIWQIHIVTTNTFQKDSSRRWQENLINAICVLIGHLTHSTAFYIYLYASSTFRRELKKILWPNYQVTPTNHSSLSDVSHSKKADGRHASRANIHIIYGQDASGIH